MTCLGVTRGTGPARSAQNSIFNETLIMSFADVAIKQSYQSYRDDILKDFLVPILSEAKTYDRAVGYFSSSALIGLSLGLYKFIKNNGKLRIIASPSLTIDDFKAIQEGYDQRRIVEQSLIRTLKDPDVYSETAKNRLEFLACLIRENIIDFRIAFSNKGLFHIKWGFVRDSEGRECVFNGSLNETGSAFYNNFESIDVFTNWLNPINDIYIREKREFFESLWDGREPYVQVVRSEQVEETIIKKYLRKTKQVDSFFKIQDQDDLDINSGDDEYEKLLTSLQTFPKPLRPYQIEAVYKFLENEGRGIFDMATGTGKTIAALGAMSALTKKVNNQLGIIIVAPLTYLVKQWGEELLDKLNITPIVADGEHDWEKQILKSLADFQKAVKQKKECVFCVVTTNNTFESAKFQGSLKKLRVGSLLLVVDEAHNFGTQAKLTLLDEKFKFRLALSATFDRHRDKAGTEALNQYFGPRCIEYSLGKAIEQGFLTPYEYHVRFVSMNEQERQAYKQLSKKIGSFCRKDQEGQVTFAKGADALLMERARLVATVSGKIQELDHLITECNLQDEHGILVYCGTSGFLPNCLDYIEEDSLEELRQIDKVSQLLHRKYGMRCAQYTSKILAKDREILVDDLKDNRIQGLVAIKCLDEGVDIPNIKYALILASTTNPKEYIQRRGRVLRKCEGKTKAVIYDFVVLPFSYKECHNLFRNGKDKTTDLYRSLIAKQVQRMKDFKDLALNRVDITSAYLTLCQDFNIDPINPMSHVSEDSNYE